MSRVHGEAVKGRVVLGLVLRESNVKFVDIRVGRVLVSAREPEGVGWAPGDGTYKYIGQTRKIRGERVFGVKFQWLMTAFWAQCLPIFDRNLGL